MSDYYKDDVTIFMSKFLIAAISLNPHMDEKVLLYRENTLCLIFHSQRFSLLRKGGSCNGNPTL